MTACPKPAVLEHRQALVVVHRDHHVGVGETFPGERGIGRDRAAGVDSLRAQRLHRGCDRLDLLASQMTPLARVRVQSADHDTRGGDRKTGAQVARDDPDDVDQHRGVDGVGHRPQRKMGGGEGHLEPGGAQHHDRPCPAVQLGEELGVAGERDPRVVDDSLVHRCGHEPGDGSLAAGIGRRADALDHVGAVCRVQASGDDAAGRGDRNHGQLARRDRFRDGDPWIHRTDPDLDPQHLGPPAEQVRVREGDERHAARRCRGQRDIGTDPGRLSRSQRGSASDHSSSRYST